MNRIFMSLADQINELNSLEGLTPWERLKILTSEPGRDCPACRLAEENKETFIPEHDHDENCDCVPGNLSNPDQILFDADLRNKLVTAGDRYLATVTIKDIM